MGYVRFQEGISIERPHPQKMGLLLVAYTFIHQKKGGALLLLVVDFSQFSKSYIRFTKKTHSKEMTPQLQLPHYLHFGSFGPSNTTTRQCRLWWRKPKKGVISTIRIGSMGLVYLLYIHHLPWGWCIDVLWFISLPN